MATKVKSILKNKTSRQYHDVIDSNLNLTDATAQTVTSAVTLNGGLTLGGGAEAAATDAAFYILNGSRGEIRSQLQTGCAADTGFTLELRNTSIAADSLVIANVIGGEGGILTGSVVTANVPAASTASLNFFNTGAALVDNATFTASFAVL